jgi:hypothetical protein
MRLSDLTNIDEAWYDPRTWGKQARQDAAGSKIGAGYTAATTNLDKQNAAGSKIGAGYATAAAAGAPKPARTNKAAPAAAPAAAAPAVDADLEQRKEVARLFGTDKNAPVAKPATAAIPSNQVAAAAPAAAPAADPTKDPYSAATDPSLQAGNKEIAAAPPPPDVEAMKKGIAAGSPAAQAAAPTQTAAAPASAPAKQNTAAPASAGGYAQSATAADNNPTLDPAASGRAPTNTSSYTGEAAAPSTAAKIPSPLKKANMEENTMKNLLSIFTEAPAVPSTAAKGGGVFPTSKADIMAWQKANGLKPDGLIGNKTFAAMSAADMKAPPGFQKVPNKPKVATSNDPTRDPYNPSRDKAYAQGDKEIAKAPTNNQPANSEPTSYPDTATFGGKAYSDNVPLSKSASMAQSQNDPLMNPQPDAKPTQVGSDASTSGGSAKPSDPAGKTPDNVGPIVRTGTGGVLTTSDGTPVRSRSADEIANTGAFGIQKPTAADREQGEKNWKSVKNFLGFGDKPDASAAPTSGGSAKPSNQTPEVMIENELSEILRLSGLQLNEKAVSKQQQKFMGMVHSMQKGEKVKGASSELKKAAKDMSKKDAKDFAATKHKGLPQKVTEGIMLEAGNTLEHIINKFKHETKNFLAGSELDKDLFEALFDYYNDNGEMPYGVAKARDGDPYQWIEQRLENELDMMGYQRTFDSTTRSGDPLSELARLAGLHESKIDECGDMSMNQPDTFNVSTNLSSDGTKSINISAQGDKADALMQMLKMAGMRPHDDHDHMSHEEPEIVLVSSDDEMMEEPELEEERITQYANTPEEEYETIAAITRQGNDLNREKQQWNPDRGRDNPMAIELEESLAAMLESIKVTEGGVGGIDAEQPYKDPKTGKMITPPKGATMPPPDNEFPAGDKRNLIPPKQNPKQKDAK